MKVPVIDISDCTLCAACYPEAEVDDAIKHCPQDCISWEDV